MQHKALILLIFLSGFLNQKVIGQNVNAPEINVVYGEKHIFTIETPDFFINDKEFAQKIGLVCFFYPKDEIDNSKKDYFYANGIDKKNQNETIETFIKADLKQFQEKYSELKYDSISIGFNGGLKNGIMYSFSNLTDRYKEEVLYAETDESFIIFSFAAMTKETYEKYQSVFDKFVSSFKYRGNNPQPFLDYLNNKNK